MEERVILSMSQNRFAIYLKAAIFQPTSFNVPTEKCAVSPQSIVQVTFDSSKLKIQCRQSLYIL